LLEGHKVTGVSDHEIATLARPLVEPFSVEKSLHAATGGKYEKAEKPFEDYVVTSKGDDGRVIVTGQNPASGLEFGRAVWEAIFGEKYEA
jgi:putative intracellular protease/amidase